MKRAVSLLLSFVPLLIFGGFLANTWRSLGRSRLPDPLPASSRSVRWRLTYQEYGYTFERSGDHLFVRLWSPKESGPYARVYHPGIRFAPKENYTLRFRARADRHRRILFGLQWSPFSLPGEDSEVAGELSTTWASYQRTFRAEKEYGTAFVTIGHLPGTVELADIAVVAASDPLWNAGWMARDYKGLTAVCLILCFGPLLFFHFSLTARLPLLFKLLSVTAFGAIALDYLVWRFCALNVQCFPLSMAFFSAEAFGIAHVLGFQLTLLWPALGHLFTKGSVAVPPTLPHNAAHPPVFVLIPTVDEGVPVVSETLRAALHAALQYQATRPDATFTVAVCNDGKVAGYSGWRGIEAMVHQAFDEFPTAPSPLLSVRVLTREAPGGAKAGNLEHARRVLGVTGNAVLVVLDADQVVRPNVFEVLLPPLLADEKVGWVQLPQWYRNQENALARAAQAQQEVFYNLICPARSPMNAAFVCGTNVAIRALYLDAIGGFPQYSLTEDVAASLRMHPRCRSVYLPENLVAGLGPMDVPAYCAQQRRWAVGMFDLLKQHFWPDLVLGRSGLSAAQRFQYTLALTHYLRGVRDALFFLTPVVFLAMGASPLSQVGTTNLVMHLAPMLVLALVLLLSRGNFSWQAESLAFATFPVYIGALGAALLGRRVRFAVTPKRYRALKGWPLWPQTFAFVAGLAALAISWRHLFADAGVTFNALWVAFYMAQLFTVFVLQKRVRDTSRAYLKRTPLRALVFSCAGLAVTVGAASYLNKRNLHTNPFSPQPRGQASLLLGRALYDDRDPRTLTWWAENRLEFPATAAVLKAMTTVPTAVWLNGRQGDAEKARLLVLTASAQGKLPVFVIYNLPKRDFSAGYSRGGAESAADYRRWVDGVAAALDGHSSLVIVEPDALPQLLALPPDLRTERIALLRYAIERFAKSRHFVYLDAGHSGWLGTTVAAGLLKECGVAQAHGFSLNVSNFRTLEESTGYAVELSQLTGGKTCVIDTSRSGNGPAQDEAWCNPPGRALGPLPTTRTTFPIDALLWIKRPWESDGNQYGAPAAGELYAAYAFELARNAGWRVSGGP